MSHYEERLQRDLDRIERRLGKLGQGVLDALRNATRSVLSGDPELATETILGDLPINRRYRELDDRCHVFVARHLPSAGHLRFISSVMRLNKTLERIGDYAETISRAALQLTDRPPDRIAQDIEMMSRHAEKILEQSLLAFQERSSDRARGTLAVAGQYGTTFDKVFADLIAEGERNSRPLSDLFSLMAIFNRFERVIHQAKNICERTVFAVTGETKDEKTFDILFVDTRNVGASQLAEHAARKAYAEGGTFQSAGWAPEGEIDAAYLDFAEQRGLDLRDATPREFGTIAGQIQDFDIVIDLSEKASEHIRKVPFHTMVLSWKLEDREDPEAVYKQLAPRLDSLMTRLRGEDVDD